MGATVTGPVQDPLTVLRLDNQLYILTSEQVLYTTFTGLNCLFRCFNTFFHQNKDMMDPAVVAEWLKALLPNSSRESPEGPEFKSHLRYGTA